MSTRRSRLTISLILLALAGLQGVRSGWATRGLEHAGNYDTAYYYTVGRNLAVGRGLVDTMNWHYLGPTRPAVAPAGDCWMVGWPVVLGGLMALVGHDPGSASRIMAGLSTLLPVATFALAHRCRSKLPVAALAGLLVCLQVRLDQTNASTDVTLCYQLLALLGLTVGLRAIEGDGSLGRWVFAGLILALPASVRGEGFVALVAVALTRLVVPDGQSIRRRVVQVVALGIGAVIGMVPLWSYHLVRFGRLNPSPRLLTFWLTSMDELYRFDGDPTPAQWWAQGVGTIIGERWRCLRALAYQAVIQTPPVLLIVAGLGLIAGLGRRPLRPGPILLGLFVALSALVPTTLVPFFTNPDRFVMHITPILCILAALLVGEYLDRAAARPGWWVGWVAVGTLAFAVAAGCVLAPAPLNRQGHFDRGWKAQFAPVPAPLRPEGRPTDLRPGDVVLTQDPWLVAAVLDVPTVMIPYDGPDACHRVVERYQPRFALLPRAGAASANPAIAPHLAAIRRDLAASGYVERSATADATWFERRPVSEPGR